MNSKEITAKSIEEAIKIAVDEFNVSEDKLDISIIEKESKGLLGIFGGKDAKIKVSLKEEIIEIQKEIDQIKEEVLEIEKKQEVEVQDCEETSKRVLTKILDKMYINCDIVTEKKMVY